ncbi:hypothetical protein D3C71_1498090 [compost metagenome]
MYSGVPMALMGSPNSSPPCFWIASTSGLLPASGFIELASSMRLISTVMPALSAAASAITWRMLASTSTGFSSGIMRRSSLNTTLPGTTLVLVPPSMRPTFRYGCVMPSTFDVTFW